MEGADPVLRDLRAAYVSAAVAFPLDGNLSEPAFVSAFRVFSLLSREKTMPCGLVLLGWTSLGSETVGRQIWEGSATASPPASPPELDQFRTMSDPGDASLSAIFNVSEGGGGAILTIEGSPVLIDKARTTLPASSAHIRQSGGKPSRAPMVAMTGPEAEVIACATIRSYSAYVAALFDNFD
ncbi:hypothetical protein SLS62_002867 [Diatrype stigma]|uniref:Uncharacterized protein n=1 Tax=Diatrype stigma TaxID=117547 RepID=A0AAN9UXE3_9PEZI